MQLHMLVHFVDSDNGRGGGGMERDDSRPARGIRRAGPHYVYTFRRALLLLLH